MPLVWDCLSFTNQELCRVIFNYEVSVTKDTDQGALSSESLSELAAFNEVSALGQVHVRENSVIFLLVPHWCTYIHPLDV